MSFASATMMERMRRKAASTVELAEKVIRCETEEKRMATHSPDDFGEYRAAGHQDGKR